MIQVSVKRGGQHWRGRRLSTRHCGGTVDDSESATSASEAGAAFVEISALTGTSSVSGGGGDFARRSIWKIADTNKYCCLSHLFSRGWVQPHREKEKEKKFIWKRKEAQGQQGGQLANQRSGERRGGLAEAICSAWSRIRSSETQRRRNINCSVARRR